MDNMFRDKKDTQENLKDPSTLLGISSSNVSLTLSYTKTDKLITALYMVTDIIDKDEPLRNKLRTLGTGIISDINNTPALACRKISEMMSFLDIASAMNIISQMNCNILRKEFLELDQSVKESVNESAIIDRKVNLSEFFTEEESGDSHPSLLKNNYRAPMIHTRNGHSLGIQKGKTLLKAIKDMSAREHPARPHDFSGAGGFDVLKKQRREDIINVIKIIGGSATIKDIKDKARSLPAGAGSLANCGGKTLQRELVSMVKDGVLNKTGEKRWSKYFVKS